MSLYILGSATNQPRVTVAGNTYEGKRCRKGDEDHVHYLFWVNLTDEEVANGKVEGGRTLYRDGMFFASNEPDCHWPGSGGGALRRMIRCAVDNSRPRDLRTEELVWLRNQGVCIVP